MKTSSIVLLIICLTTISSFAEFLVWTDNKGHTIEAEFIGVRDDGIVLRNRDGKEFKVSPTTRCAEDQNFLKGKIPDDLSLGKSELTQEKPPRIDIDVKRKSDTIRTQDDWVERDVVCNVEVTKKSRETYDKTLKASLVVIGISKREKYFVILDRKDFTFDFKSSDEILLNGKASRTRHYRSYDYGVEYEGYVAVVYDGDGNELMIKGTGNKFENNRSLLFKLKRDDVVDSEFEKIGIRSKMGYYY